MSLLIQFQSFETQIDLGQQTRFHVLHLLVEYLQEARWKTVDCHRKRILFSRLIHGDFQKFFAFFCSRGQIQVGDHVLHVLQVYRLCGDRLTSSRRTDVDVHSEDENGIVCGYELEG